MIMIYILHYVIPCTIESVNHANLVDELDKSAGDGNRVSYDVDLNMCLGR